MWTVDAIKAEIESFIEYANQIVGDIPSAKNVPVEIGDRMTKRMGSFHFKISNEKLVPVKFKFAKVLLTHYDEQHIKDTIKHEVVHYIVNLRYQKNMCHNEVFMQFCRMLGVEPSIYFNAKPIKPLETKEPRYYIKCSGCGAVIPRKKMGEDRALEILAHCHCGKCKSKFNFIYDSKLDEVMHHKKLKLLTKGREAYEKEYGEIFGTTYGRLK